MSANIETNMFCKKCGTPLSEENLFCHNCGAKIQRDVVVEAKVESSNFEFVEDKPVVKNKKPKAFVFDIIKKSVILAIAIFMIIATFLPIVRYDIEYPIDDSNEEIAVKFTAIDGIHMLFNSWGYLDEDVMLDEIDELDDEFEKYMDDWDKGEELKELSAYLKKMAKLILRSDSVNTSWELVFIGIFSVAQIILSVLLLVFAALSFAALFTNKIKDFSKSSFVIMGINAVLLAVNGFALGLFIGDTSASARLTAIQICVLVFAFLLFVALALIRIFINKNKMRISEIIKRSLGFVFAVSLLLSCFAPIVSTEVKVKFDNKDEARRVSTTLDPSLFGEFSVDEQTKEDLSDTSYKEIDARIEHSYSMFETYTKREFENGKANGINTSIFAGLLLNYGLYDFCGLFAFGGAAVILIFLCAVVFIWKNLYELATGERLSSGISLFAKILGVAMSVIVLALIIAACVIVKFNVDFIDIVYKVRIAYGPILMLISAIALTCIPDALRKNNKKHRYQEEVIYFDETKETTI